MVVLFYVLIVEQLLQGFYSLWQGWQWLRTAQRRMAEPVGFFTPRVAVLCPVKGLEPGLEANLSALTRFDYPHYEIFFAIATADDPAYKVLEKVAAATKCPVHIIRAGRPVDCGEKVNNLSTAVEQVGPEFNVIVFVDSDGRPPRRWLAHLVAPLADNRVGAATTFRWLLPERPGLWSALASAWNASIVTYLGEHDHNFCWGGGTAIRRQRFEDLRVQQWWQGSVSDDYSLTEAIRAAGLRIAFVPECLMPSSYQTNASGFFEFTTRQLVITRVYAPRLWLMAAASHLPYCVAVLLGLTVSATSWLAGLQGVHFLVLTLTLPMIAALRGVLRLLAVLDLQPEFRQKLLKDGWVWVLLAPFVPFVYIYNTFRAGFTRKIRWRGMHYELISPGRTRILVR
jgi:ceramide glucosyltransferase